MSKGGGETRETQSTDQRTSNYLSDEIRDMSLGALIGGSNLYNQGTEGIYQGARLAGQDELVGMGEQTLLDLYGRDGAVSGLVGSGQGRLSGLLGAADAFTGYDGSTADLANNKAFQDQMASILSESNVAFERGAVPIMQQATAAGQFGGSEAGESLGLLGGEINRATQKALTDAAVTQQKLDLDQRKIAQQDKALAYETALAAQNLLPQYTSQLERAGGLMSAIGQDRSAREQAELMDTIQQFDAPRMAELANLVQFYEMLGSNPLMQESIGTTTGTTVGVTQAPEADPFSQLLGVGLAIGGMGTPMGGSILGDFLTD